MLATPSARDWRSGKSNQHGKNARPLNEQFERMMLPTPATMHGSGDMNLGVGRIAWSGSCETGGHIHQPDWQAGLPDFAQLDDGPAAELARNGALYRAICAAQGDAIVPQVACQIVRVMSAMFPDARRALDLFSGAVGGWTYACRWAGLEVIAACEIDPWRREVYQAVHHAPSLSLQRCSGG
jgi:hypothetical protein